MFERCKPVLEAITAYHFHLGEIGSAVAMKLIANTLVAIHTLAAAEAMNLGARAGFNPHRVAEVIKQGAGNSAMFTIRAPMMAARSFSPAPGPFNTLHKYLQMGADMARELGAPRRCSPRPRRISCVRSKAAWARRTLPPSSS